MAAQIKRLNLSDNIIAQAEFRYQRYVLRTSRSGGMWILLAVLLLFPGLVTSLVLFGFGLTGTDPNVLYIAPSTSAYTPKDALVTLGIVSMITMNVALYLVVMLITLGLSANSISREKTKRTWEVLLLTNIDSRSLVIGKYWASLRALVGDHTMLAILRVGAVSFLVAQFGDELPGVLGLPSGLSNTLILSVFVVIYTVLDASFTVLLGIIGSLSDLPGSISGATVLFVRMFALVINFAIAGLLGYIVIEDGAYLLSACLAVIMGLLANWIAFRFAQAIAIRGQVSAPADR